jgi:hypothetical protein
MKPERKIYVLARTSFLFNFIHLLESRFYTIWVCMREAWSAPLCLNYLQARLGKNNVCVMDYFKALRAMNKKG